MNFFRAILLLVALSVGQPTVQRYKVDNFSASDSLSVLLVRGPISGVPYRPLRVTSAGNSFELGAVTGTGAAVNAISPNITGYDGSIQSGLLTVRDFRQVPRIGWALKRTTLFQTLQSSGNGTIYEIVARYYPGLPWREGSVVEFKLSKDYYSAMGGVVSGFINAEGQIRVLEGIQGSSSTLYIKGPVTYNGNDRVYEIWVATSEYHRASIELSSTGLATVIPSSSSVNVGALEIPLLRETTYTQPDSLRSAIYTAAVYRNYTGGNGIRVGATGAPSYTVDVRGTLGVTDATTLQSTLAVTGNVSVNTDKFKVEASTGNVTSGAKTLLVSGSSSSGTTSLRLLSGITNTSGLNTVGDSLSPFIASSGGGSYPFNSFGALILSGRHQKTQSSRIVMMTGQEVRAVMDSGGFLGLGTENPSERLHVVGGGRVTGLFSTTEQKINPVNMTPGFNGTNKAIRINFYGNGDQDVSAPIWFGRDGSSSGAGIAAYQATADNDRVGLLFFVHPSPTSTDPSIEAARLTTGGNLLLNYGLSVAGASTFAGVNMVGSNNSADYLFSSVARAQTLAVGGPEQGLVPVLTSNNTTLELAGDLSVTGGVTSSTVNVTSLTAGGSTVNGTATFNGNISATAPATFSSIDVGSIEASSVDIGGGSMNLTGNGGSLFFVNSGATHTRLFPGTSVDYSGTLETGSIVSKGTISATGNLAVAGGTFSGNVSIGTNKFTVSATTGNTTVAGKLTLNGGLEVNGALTMNPLYLSEDGGGYSLEYYGSRIMHKADGVEAMAVYDDSVEVHGILRVGGVAQMSGGVNTSTLRSPAGPISVHIAGSGTPQHVLAATFAEFPATVRVKAPSGGSGTLWVQANNGATSADSWAFTAVGGGTQSLQMYAATYGGNQNFIRLDANVGNVILQKSTVLSSGNNLTLQQGNVILSDGTIQVQTFTGGTAFACWDPFGNLFRSTSPCL